MRWQEERQEPKLATDTADVEALPMVTKWCGLATHCQLRSCFYFQTSENLFTLTGKGSLAFSYTLQQLFQAALPTCADRSWLSSAALRTQLLSFGLCFVHKDTRTKEWPPSVRLKILLCDQRDKAKHTATAHLCTLPVASPFELLSWASCGLCSVATVEFTHIRHLYFALQ